MLDYLIKKKPKPSQSDYEFKMLHSFESRKNESDRLREKYPNNIPIIVEKSDSSNVADVDKHKWLPNGDLTVGQFIYIIRKRIKLEASQALFFFVNNKHIPTTSDTIKQVYKLYKDKDNFLYITYSTTEAYGN